MLNMLAEEQSKTTIREAAPRIVVLSAGGVHAGRSSAADTPGPA